MGGTLLALARDVKVQVEFNPARAAGYRLIGYENRLLDAEDFNDDTEDAGELGARHTVTALYEVVPAGLPVPGGSVDDLRYQPEGEGETAVESGFGEELMYVKVWYKDPDGSVSRLLEQPVVEAPDCPPRISASPRRWPASACCCATRPMPATTRWSTSSGLPSGVRGMTRGATGGSS